MRLVNETSFSTPYEPSFWVQSLHSSPVCTSPPAIQVIFMGFSRLEMVSGAIHCGLSVMMGAFAAHGLKSELSPRMLEVLEVGVRYQFYHGLALLVVAVAIGLLGTSEKVKSMKRVGYCFQAGIIFFSGSLYILSIFGIPKMGMITPIGGVLFLVGWFLLAWQAYKKG